MKELLRGSFVFLLTLLNLTCSSSRNKTTLSRDEKFLSVFTVVKFPNEACGSTSGLNGTCYTSSQCESLGGSSSGSCASSFGVCCVFSLSCGGSSSQNNTYATMTGYTVSSDPDPCTYTFCKSNSDVCKLRIDYETMNIGKGCLHFTLNNMRITIAMSNTWCSYFYPFDQTCPSTRFLVISSEPEI